MEQPFLLLEEAPNNSGHDVAARGIEGRPRLSLPSGVRAKRVDDELPKETREQWHPLPGSSAPPALSDLLDDLKVWAIRDNQVVKALADAPLSSTRRPVDLLCEEPPERASCLVGDQAPLGQDR